MTRGRRERQRRPSRISRRAYVDCRRRGSARARLVGSLGVREAAVQVQRATRVGFSDTDAQGIVYYGRYNPYFDLARVEYHRTLGLLHARRRSGDFVMRANDVEYFAPARFDDELEVYARVARIGRTSVDLRVRRLPGAGRRRSWSPRTRRSSYVDLDERKASPVPGRVPRRRSARSRATMSSTSGALEAIERIVDARRRRRRHPARGRRRAARAPATRGPASPSSRTATSCSARSAGTPDETAPHDACP